MSNEFKDVMMTFQDTASFTECWDSFVQHRVIDDTLTFRQICSVFFGLGVVDMIKKVHKKELEEACAPHQ